MTRRLAAYGAAALVAVSAAWWWTSGRRSAEDFERTAARNLLLVTIDTLRADALGCYGGPARTPNLDRLAATGVRFTFAHAHAVITLPSHASILTGRYPFEHGYRENSGYRLVPGTPTLATLAKAAGFATAAFVGAFPLDARFGLADGFDVYDGRFDDAGVQGTFAIPERPAAEVIRSATAWIAQRRAPWVAWVHLYDPHAPYEPPAPFDREYAGRPYYGEVAAVDRALAPLLSVLDTAERRTLTIVTGDHGEALGDHGEATHGVFAYESTLRVPLIVSEIGPGARALGEVSAAPVRHVDLLPTVLDALGIAAPAGLPGRSLRSRAARNDGTPHPSYFEAMSGMLEFGWAPLRGVLTGREKYIDVPLPELYDLDADTAERDNLLGRRPERQRTLAATLDGLHADLPASPLAEQADVAARLRALGYVSGPGPRKAQYTEADDPKRLIGLDAALQDGVALDQQGRTADAIAAYRRVLETRPAMTSAARHLAFDLWKTGDVDGAIRVLRAAIDGGSGTPGARVQLATYLAEAGRAADAIALLAPAAGAGADLDTLNALGIAYARDGKPREALLTFERSLAIDPANAMTLENAGTVYLQAGDAGQAKRAFDAALASNPRSSQSHAGLAMIALRSGDREEAIARWTRAVDLDPENYDALYDLGVQLLRAGRRDAARPYLERFAATAPRSLYARDIDEIKSYLGGRR